MANQNPHQPIRDNFAAPPQQQGAPYVPMLAGGNPNAQQHHDPQVYTDTTFANGTIGPPHQGYQDPWTQVPQFNNLHDNANYNAISQPPEQLDGAYQGRQASERVLDRPFNEQPLRAPGTREEKDSDQDSRSSLGNRISEWLSKQSTARSASRDGRSQNRQTAIGDDGAQILNGTYEQDTIDSHNRENLATAAQPYVSPQALGANGHGLEAPFEQHYPLQEPAPFQQEAQYQQPANVKLPYLQNQHPMPPRPDNVAQQEYPQQQQRRDAAEIWEAGEERDRQLAEQLQLRDYGRRSPPTHDREARRRETSRRRSPSARRGRRDIRAGGERGDRGEAADYYDDTQTFSTNTDRHCRYRRHQRRHHHRRHTPPPIEIEQHICHSSLKPGIRGFIKGMFDLSRKKPYVHNDTPERLDLMRRADRFFTEGFIGLCGGLSKHKKDAIGHEVFRVAQTLEGEHARDIDWSGPKVGERRRRMYEESGRGADRHARDGERHRTVPRQPSNHNGGRLRTHYQSARRRSRSHSS